MVKRNADHIGVNVRNGARARALSGLESDVETSAVLEVLGKQVRDVQCGTVVATRTPAHSDLSKACIRSGHYRGLDFQS